MATATKTKPRKLTAGAKKAAPEANLRKKAVTTATKLFVSMNREALKELANH